MAATPAPVNVPRTGRRRQVRAHTGRVHRARFRNQIAGGHCSVLFELVDATFHGMPLLVDLQVERRWAAALGAAFASVPGLVLRDWMVHLIPRRRR
jgi:hypothetical protein